MDELVLYNPDVKSEVMSRAGELRSAGLDASEALTLAWSELSNPYYGNPVRRRARPAETGGIGLVALLGIGYLVWCVVVMDKTGVWNWTPWKTRAIVIAQPKSNPSPPVAGYKTYIPISPTVYDQWNRPVQEGFSIITP